MKRSLTVLTAALLVAAFIASPAEAASSPSVKTGSATSIGQNSATLNGTINPNGSATTYLFQWGLTTAYGASSMLTAAGAGTTAISVSAHATHLIPGTVYHFRLIASNGFGQSLGTDHKFKTAGTPPPAVATGPPIQLSPFSATVSGVVNPRGLATAWYVQYGLSTAYGTQTFARTLPANSEPTTVTEQLRGLSAGAICPYRFVAKRSGTPTQYGADATFVTYPFPPPVPRILSVTKPHRARHKPFVFTTSALVVPPRSAPRSVACTGTAVIFYFFGKKQVGHALVPLRVDCFFSARIGFKHKLRKHKVKLRVLIHFRGNSYLAPANARPETVVLG
jgi:hypothetical protein